MGNRRNPCVSDGCKGLADSRAKSGLCRACYLKLKEKKPAQCEACPRFTHLVANGQCARCYYKDYQRERNLKRVRTPEEVRTSREQQRNRHRKKLGFTPDMCEALVIHQNFQCGICTKPGTTESLFLDHCHATGHVRGFLCQFCNNALGGYENHQKRYGLLLTPYEAYLAAPPARSLPALQ